MIDKVHILWQARRIPVDDPRWIDLGHGVQLMPIPKSGEDAIFENHLAICDEMRQRFSLPQGDKNDG